MAPRTKTPATDHAELGARVADLVAERNAIHAELATIAADRDRLEQRRTELSQELNSVAARLEDVLR